MSIFYGIEAGPVVTLSDLLGHYSLDSKDKIAIAYALAGSSSENHVAAFWGSNNVQYSMESRPDGLYISPRNPFISVRPDGDALGNNEVLCLKIGNLRAMLMEFGIGAPMVSFCDEHLGCAIKYARECGRFQSDFWHAARWCLGFASKEAGENLTKIFEERVLVPLAHLNQGSQERQICHLKTGVIRPMEKTNPNKWEREAKLACA